MNIKKVLSTMCLAAIILTGCTPQNSTGMGPAELQEESKEAMQEASQEPAVLASTEEVQQEEKAEAQDDDNGTELAASENEYFYPEIGELNYSVEEFFFEEIEEVPVKVEHLASYEGGEVYSINIQYEDLPESDYYGGNRYVLGPVYVTKDSIYVLPWREDVPTEAEFLENRVLICSATDGVYAIDEEIGDDHGYRSVIENEGDVCKCSIYNPSQGTTFYWTYEWTKGKGLTYLSTGYGAMGNPIVIALK